MKDRNLRANMEGGGGFLVVKFLLGKVCIIVAVSRGFWLSELLEYFLLTNQGKYIYAQLHMGNISLF